MRFGKVEIVHRARDVEIGIGIEAVGKGQPLMAQIGFDLEIGVEAEALGIACLQPAAEFFGQPGFGQIGDVRRHARDRQPFGRGAVAAVILAVLPVGIGHDRLPPHLVKGDILRRMARGACDNDRRRQPFGIGRSPAERLHSAHRSADDGMQPRNP